jgi:hypothetical protein
MKSDVNPMQRAHQSPRCTAHSKRSGYLCKNPAVRGWAVCRMHGAGGGAASGPKHPNYRHGVRAKEMSEVRALIRELSGSTAWGDI